MSDPAEDAPDDWPEDSPDERGESRNVDAAWDAIVANYGDRAELDEQAPPFQPPPSVHDAEDGDEFADAWWAREEHFVPPTPPPAPLPEGARGAAWLGVLGSPAAMLLLVIFRVAIPTWLGLALFAAFVGGLVYLISVMPRGGDDDPFSGDDGAVV